MRFSRRFVFLASIILVFLACAYHLWTDRYFLRFVPLPLAWADVVNSHSAWSPAYQDGRIKGTVDLPRHDMTTAAGLRATLNDVRAYGPIFNKTGFPDYKDLTFEKWLRTIKEKFIQCTDATQLFISAAWAQGLKAREWHLLWPGWPAGGGHSIAEFYNPLLKKWQLVDAQHAAIFKDAESGETLNMLDVLARYRNDRVSSIRIDHGPYADIFTGPGKPGPTYDQLFTHRLLSTPVLQLRQATWYAEYPRTQIISGHFVIGYPLVVDDWTHRSEVLWTKLSLVVFLLSGMTILFCAYQEIARRQRLVSGQEFGGHDAPN